MSYSASTTCTANSVRNCSNKATSKALLQASRRSRVRYQRFSQAKSTRTRGALLARRAASSRHCGSQRRPRSSQTKAASSQGAGPCSEAGSSRRLATGAKARSASSRPAEAAQDAVELQVLVPEGAQDQQRAPVPGLHGGLRRGRGAGRAPAAVSSSKRRAAWGWSGSTRPRLPRTRWRGRERPSGRRSR